AAGAVGAAPEVAVAARARRQAAAQVLAQHQRAMAGLDEPGPAAAAVVDLLRARPPLARVEPARVDLPQLRGVEQNRPILPAATLVVEGRQAFSGVERGHPASLTSRDACSRSPPLDLPAAPVRARRRDPCAAPRAHPARRLAGGRPGL